MQNPPALPSMLVCWFACRLRGAVFVIDWHNYGYSILSLSLGRKHLLVSLSKVYERILGRMSDFNICVTLAMREDLREKWKIKATTLYDRPPAMFKESSVAEKHKLFVKLQDTYPEFSDSSGVAGRTRLTECSSE